MSIRTSRGSWLSVTNYDDLHTFITLIFETFEIRWISLETGINYIKKYLKKYNEKNGTCHEFKYMCTSNPGKKRG